MFDRFKNFVLSTFARNVPLIIKTSRGGVFSFRGGPFFIWGKGLYLPMQPSPGYPAVQKQSNSYIYPSTLIETILLVISNRSHISTCIWGILPLIHT